MQACEFKLIVKKQRKKKRCRERVAERSRVF